MRKMIAGVVMIVLLATASVSHSQEPATQPTVAELQKQIEKLRAENQRLKEENDALRRRRVTIVTPPTTRPYELRIDPQVIPRQFRDRLGITPGPRATTRPFNFILPEPRNVPNDWVPKQFNGQTFYVIPLAEESRPRAAVSR